MKVGVVALLTIVGSPVIETVGGVTSTVHEYVIVVPTLPALSTARIWSVWLASDRLA